MARRDRPDRLTAGPAERDLLPLRQRQTPALQVTAPTRSDPTRRSQPPAALLAIRAGRDGGIGDELTSRHRRPEHLIDLRNHPIREPHRQHLRLGMLRSLQEPGGRLWRPPTRSGSCGRGRVSSCADHDGADPAFVALSPRTLMHRADALADIDLVRCTLSGEPGCVVRSKVGGVGTPTLMVVSGPAGSGKTTLAHELAVRRRLPGSVCRDEIKEGMVASNPGPIAATSATR